MEAKERQAITGWTGHRNSWVSRGNSTGWPASMCRLLVKSKTIGIRQVAVVFGPIWQKYGDDARGPQPKFGNRAVADPNQGETMSETVVGDLVLTESDGGLRRNSGAICSKTIKLWRIRIVLSAATCTQL